VILNTQELIKYLINNFPFLIASLAFLLLILSFLFGIKAGPVYIRGLFNKKRIKELEELKKANEEQDKIIIELKETLKEIKDRKGKFERRDDCIPLSEVKYRLNQMRTMGSKRRKKEIEMFGRQIMAAINLKPKVNSYEYPYVEEVVYDHFKKSGVIMVNVKETVEYWYAIYTICDLDFINIKAIIEKIIINGFTKLIDKKFLEEYLPTNVNELMPNISNRLETGLNEKIIQFDVKGLVDEFMSSKTMLRVKKDIEQVFKDIRQIYLDEEEYLNGLIKEQNELEIFKRKKKGDKHDNALS
jgi:hypothetical protein